MVQTLQMEPAWEKTVSNQDRTLIQQKFNSLSHTEKAGFVYTYLRHDFNHCGALLVIAIVHNYEDSNQLFENEKVHCSSIDGTPIATEVFTIPAKFRAKTSMPWTFIYPKETYHLPVLAKEEMMIK